MTTGFTGMRACTVCGPETCTDPTHPRATIMPSQYAPGTSWIGSRCLDGDQRTVVGVHPNGLVYGYERGMGGPGKTAWLFADGSKVLEEHEPSIVTRGNVLLAGFRTYDFVSIELDDRLTLALLKLTQDEKLYRSPDRERVGPIADRATTAHRILDFIRTLAGGV